MANISVNQPAVQNNASIRIAKNIPAEARDTPTTNGTETLRKDGVPGELNSTREPTINEATPAAVSAPWVGALISRTNSTKAIARKINPNQLTGRKPNP